MEKPPQKVPKTPKQQASSRFHFIILADMIAAIWLGFRLGWVAFVIVMIVIIFVALSMLELEAGKTSFMAKAGKIVYKAIVSQAKVADGDADYRKFPE